MRPFPVLVALLAQSAIAYGQKPTINQIRALVQDDIRQDRISVEPYWSAINGDVLSYSLPVALGIDSRTSALPLLYENYEFRKCLVNQALRQSWTPTLDKAERVILQSLEQSRERGELDANMIAALRQEIQGIYKGRLAEIARDRGLRLAETAPAPALFEVSVTFSSTSAFAVDATPLSQYRLSQLHGTQPTLTRYNTNVKLKVGTGYYQFFPIDKKITFMMDINADGVYRIE